MSSNSTQLNLRRNVSFFISKSNTAAGCCSVPYEELQPSSVEVHLTPSASFEDTRQSDMIARQHVLPRPSIVPTDKPAVVVATASSLASVGELQLEVPSATPMSHRKQRRNSDSCYLSGTPNATWRRVLGRNKFGKLGRYPHSLSPNPR